MDPVRAPKPEGLVEVFVILRPAVSSRQPEAERGREYRTLHEETTQGRERLIAWLKEQGAWGEVNRIGEANAFRILFLTCSPRVASLLKAAPDVEVAGPAGVDFELLT